MPRSTRVRSLTATLPRLAFCFLAALALGCGGGSKIQTPVPANQPTFSHVILVVEENHSFEAVIGNSAMPYLNSLAEQYGLAAQSYGDAHPSLPNYFMLTAGQTETLDDNFSGTITDDNVVRELVKAGKSWKCYAESLPSTGYIGGNALPYLRHHNPFSYFSDTQNTTPEAGNMVPFSRFAPDLGNQALPQYSFIVPNVLDDAHDGSLAQADAWLQQNIGPLIASPVFQDGGGLLIITFDEGDQTDISHGGGHVATVIVSTKSKKNYASQTLYQHASTLRLTLAASGVHSFPGTAAVAADMTEFFTGQ